MTHREQNADATGEVTVEGKHSTGYFPLRVKSKKLKHGRKVEI
jgi:hypothetical protein